MAKKKSTIGENPLDSLLGDGVKYPQREKRERLSDTGFSGDSVRQSEGKLRLTVHVPGNLIERAKNAVFWTPGLTLAALAERALRRELDLIEKERGERFPQRTSELKGGRPIKG